MTTYVSFNKAFDPWQAASGDGGRHILTGVYVDTAGYIVSADGFIMSIVPCHIDGALPGGAIIPARFVREASRNTPKRGQYVRLAISGKDVQCISAQFNQADLLMDGPWPDWRRLVPLPADYSLYVNHSFDPRNLSRIAAAIGSPEMLTLTPSGSSSHPYLATGKTVDGEREALGVVMPFQRQIDKETLHELAERVRGDGVLAAAI